MGRFELRHAPWWREESVTGFVAGVFEGGGAKGILYRGALEAMVEDHERRWWFAAVAGASAGAITAALVSAGLRPEHVAAETAEGLGALHEPRLLNGVLRMRDGLSYLDQESLLDWLRGILERQVRQLTGQDGGGTVTFEELHDLTGVELDVVAVDLLRQRPVVFNYALTPGCEVAEAVLASAAIPLAFEWRTLQIPGKGEGSMPTLGVIVDGGVISNFPKWVFTDRSFREWAGLEQVPPSMPIVGFLLDERTASASARPDLYTEAAFFPHPAKFRNVGAFFGALEGGAVPPTSEMLKTRPFRPRPQRRAERGKLKPWLKPLALPPWALGKVLFSWIPSFLRWNAGDDRGSWPPPKSRRLSTLVDWYDALMTGVRPAGVLALGFGFASLVLAVGAYFAAWRPLARTVAEIVHGDVSMWTFLVLGVLLFASVVPVYAWMLLTILFTAGWIFHRTMQQTGYGLLRTFLQNPAAPPWAGTALGDIVVRLPVPDQGLTTLHDDLGDEEREAALEHAREATRAMLRELDGPKAGRR